MALTLASSPGPASAQNPPSPGTVGIVLASSLNLRAGPRLDAEVRTTVQRGDTLCVTELTGDWAAVSTPRRTADVPALSGFVARGFLSVTRVGGEALAQAGCGPAGGIDRGAEPTRAALRPRPVRSRSGP